ncbi:NUDIX domain-containing protein [Candidatus Woesearchaeota archaeon]|nr:NUDIX domain-containing protein [Candidatus Woesearchaeota archaeon]
MKSEKSCGGIIFRKRKEKMEYLIIKHKEADGGHWDFPKGHVEKGETEEETARREIMEEVGLKVRFIAGFRGTIFYITPVTKINRTVIFFLCEALSSKVKYIFDEVEEHIWLDYDSALKRLTYENAINLLKNAYSFMEKNKV